jgi:hypothetical protein
MKREDWQAAYGPIPDALQERVSFTLSHLEKEEKIMKRAMIRTLCLAICAVLLLGATALALTNSDILKYLSQYSDTLNEEQQQMIQSDFAEDTLMLGDVQVTLKELLTDGHVGAVSVEFRAPEGAFLYSDLVNMSEEEWNKTRADYLAEYGAYYWLLDSHIYFLHDGTSKPISSDWMMDGQREASNVITAQFVFSAVDQQFDQLQLKVGVAHVTGESEETDERVTGYLTPAYTPDSSSEKTISLTMPDCTNDPGSVASIDITFTKLITVFKATLESTDGHYYSLKISDVNGNELNYTILSSIINSCDGNIVLTAYDAMAEIPDLLYAQIYRLGENGDTPVGEHIELKLK